VGQQREESVIAGLAPPKSTLEVALKSRRFEVLVTVVILFNAVILGLETVTAIDKPYGHILDVLHWVVLGLFLVELGLRMVAFRKNFWRDGWSWFDLVVVVIALVPATDSLGALRALRTMRLLRLVTAVPSLRHVIEGLLRALPGLGSIIILLLLMLYVFSVMGTQLFGEAHPELFGSLGASAFTLFTVVTLEGWPDVARTVMKEQPYAWFFFVSFIMLTSWSVLNLFIGVVVDSMQSYARKNEALLGEALENNQEDMMEELRKVREELAELKRLLAPPRGSPPGDPSP
jgi:voltage-gated sodium channel